MRRRTALRSFASLISATGTVGCLGDFQDPFETTRETSPTPPPDDDVDGDGFTSCEERQLLDGAEAGRPDVFVEVDWTEGNKPDPDAMERLINVYDNAPVNLSNRAKGGIYLHIKYGNEVPAPMGASDPATLQRYQEQHFTNSGRGHHYALFVDEYRAHMMGYGDSGALIIQGQNEDRPNDFSVKIFAHELGHSLGLGKDVFHGIDGHEIPLEEYPSVMNYASLDEKGFLDFSDGTNSERDFDDWGHLEENLYVPDKSGIETSDHC